MDTKASFVRVEGQSVRICEAIDAISKKIEDGLCEAIILKGSIGRGDDDEYSDVDMYLIVSPEKMDAVLEKRREYLSAYKEIFDRANACLFRALEVFIANSGISLKDKLDMRLFTWVKENLGSLLFASDDK